MRKSQKAILRRPYVSILMKSVTYKLPVCLIDMNLLIVS